MKFAEKFLACGCWSQRDV